MFQERADPQAAQRGDMAHGAAGHGEVAGQAAHVDPLAGGDLEHRGVRVGTLDQFEPVDAGRARFQDRGTALAGHVVSTLAGDLDGGEDRRNLHDLTAELYQRGVDRRVGGPDIAGRDDLASASSVVARLPELQGETIQLGASMT